MAYIEAMNITKSYGRKNVVLKDASFQASQGEYIAIVGANGCGKSTLLGILSGSLKADGGNLLVDGKVPIYAEDGTIREYRMVTADADIRMEHSGHFRIFLPADYILKKYTGREKTGYFMRLGDREWKQARKVSFLQYDSILNTHSMKILKNLADRIKDLREEKGLKQKEMAELLKCTVSHYQKIEYGKVNIPTTTLVILADYFQVSTDYLLGRADDRNMGQAKGN